MNKPLQLSFLSRNRAFNSSRGATLLEIAIALPSFILLITVILWIGATLNAKASLMSAVDNGMRAGVTRGNFYLTGRVPLIPVIHNDWEPGTAPPTKLHPLLFSNVEAQEGYQLYNDWVGQTWNLSADGSIRKLQLSELPEQYLYTLIYINEAMRASSGTGITFPCDPSKQEKDSRDGCLKCIFLNPCTLDQTALRDSCTFQDAYHRIAVKCEYSPAQTLGSIAGAMLSQVVGSGSAVGTVLPYTAFWDTGSDVIDWYDVDP